jgi:hypothetical protein
MNVKYKKKLIFLIISLTLIIIFNNFINKQNNNNLKEFNLVKKALYLSLHSATIDEIKYVFKLKNITHTIGDLYSFAYYRIFDHGYSISKRTATRYIQQAKKLCNEYDLIIFADTIPLGRAFYQLKYGGGSICKSKLALQITNRFDYLIPDKHAYYNLMKKLTESTEVFWIPNNEFEILYLNHKGIYPKPERTFIIKPFGVSYLERNPVKLKKSIFYSQFFVNIIKKVLDEKKVSKDLYSIYTEAKYGGPLTLKEHKIFIYFPYQFSIMKIFQNANVGVLTAIPTPRFFKQLLFQDPNEQGVWLVNNFRNWTEYYDVYQSKYIDMHLQFNDWNELIDIIQMNDTNNIKSVFTNIIKDKMEMHTKEVNQKWDEFFKITGLK